MTIASRMFALDQKRNARGDAAPIRAQFLEALVAAPGQAVIIPAAAPDILAMAADQFFLLEVMQTGIDAALAKGQRFPGFRLNGFDDFVTVHLAAGEELEDEHFRHAI